MFKKLALLAIVVALSSCTAQQIQATLDTLGGNGDGSLSISEISDGLKEALQIGITKGADRLSQTDGFYKSTYKILLPTEARKVTDKLEDVPGFKELEEEILMKINRGAEDAAKKAAPIFISAIKQMTFNDAMDILMGEQDAATNFLKRTTYDALYQEFNPVIVESLDKFKARTVWADAVNTYNKIPFVEKADPDLDDYVTNQALTGLFSMVEKEEKNIRTNITARTTDLLRKVFAKQDK
ncbi:MAG TPA: DUF4197 domain-containing protein [Saprospiraceae bacterium]|nr:DUF4197 domain-containing protein [Saprospiraceae bacterium]HMQ85133.1 DUF4197 domain-containing protein [Saprospiraceae bacterium]